MFKTNNAINKMLGKPITKDRVSNNRRMHKRPTKISEMSTSQIRQIYGDYVGNDVSDKMLASLHRQDMEEVLEGMGYQK